MTSIPGKTVFRYEIDEIDKDFLQQKARSDEEQRVTKLKDLVWKNLEKISPGKHCASSKGQANLVEYQDGDAQPILHDRALQIRLESAKGSKSMLELYYFIEEHFSNLDIFARCLSVSTGWIQSSIDAYAKFDGCSLEHVECGSSLKTVVSQCFCRRKDEVDSEASSKELKPGSILVPIKFKEESCRNLSPAEIVDILRSIEIGTLLPEFMIAFRKCLRPDAPVSIITFEGFTEVIVTPGFARALDVVTALPEQPLHNKFTPTNWAYHHPLYLFIMFTIGLL
jgi:hypothetical protein